MKWSLIYQRSKSCPICENFVLLGDFNLSTENPNLNNFMCSFDLESLIDSPACYKSVNPSCIGLILTNKKNHFMKPLRLKQAYLIIIN